MLTLLLFSLLAGVVTIFSPCVLPVLPPLLSTGFTDRRGRASGIFLGFIASFMLSIIALRQILHAIDIPGTWPLEVAAILLGFFGFLSLFPSFAEKLLRPFAALGNRLSPKSQKGSFVGGFLLGLCLGLIWTPCAGPVLATVITLASLQTLNREVFLVALAYSIGAALPMLLIIRGSEIIHTITQQKAFLCTILRSLFGVLTIIVAFTIWSGQTEWIKIWATIPVHIELENNRIIERKLSNLVHKASNNFFTMEYEKESPATSKTLPILSNAPELHGLSNWMNSPPLKLTDLRGKVVLIDFWTYSCINCLRTLPHIKRWHENYADQGLVILGIHTPEFAFEKEKENVQSALKHYQIPYAVALDNDYETWHAYNNRYWPAHYLIDTQGRLRYYHFGEGHYVETENAIRQLLNLSPLMPLKEKEARNTLTEEIYLGYARASNYPLEAELFHDKEILYHMPQPQHDEVSLQGTWQITRNSIIAAGDDCYLELNFIGAKVHLVLSGHNEMPLTITLEDRQLHKKFFTEDMDEQGRISVTAARKYDVFNARNHYGRYDIRIHVPKGISAYAFTFGGP